MAQTVNVNFRLDEADKKKMESVCSELGLSMSAAFTIFAKKMGREHRIPFEVSIDPFYCESNMEHLRRGIAALNAGLGVEHELVEVQTIHKIWFDEAWEDYQYWQVQDRKTLKRINGLIKDIERGNYDGIGKPEPLKGELSGFWSRRIDDTNRLIYRISNGCLEILSCRGHYT